MAGEQIEKIGLEAIFNTSGFMNGIGQYIASVKKANSATDAGASGMAKAWGTLAVAIPVAAVAFNFLMDQTRKNVTAAMEAEVSHAKLTATLLSTGKSAEISASQIEDLSLKLAFMSGVSDEAITDAQTMLLRYDQIGTESLPKATQAVLDMSVAMGTDMTASARMVGLALADPLVGMSRLRRMGIIFTDDQKELITTMMEVGDVAGAQGVVLEALAQKFGGAGEALGKTFQGVTERIKLANDEMREMKGEELLRGWSQIAEAYAQYLEQMVKETKLANSRKDAYLDGKITYGEYLKLMMQNKPYVEAEKKVGELGAAVEELSVATIEASDAVSITSEALKAQGVEATMTEEILSRLAVALGTISAEQQQLNQDTTLMAEAFALNLIPEEEYLQFLMDATTGVADMTEAQRTNLEGMVTSAEQMKANAEAARDTAAAYGEMAMSFLGMGEADIAKMLLDQLNVAVLSGAMGIDAYKGAVRALGLEYGLVDEASMRMAESFPTFTAMMASGQIPVDNMAAAFKMWNEQVATGPVNLQAIFDKFAEMPAGIDPAVMAIDDMGSMWTSTSQQGQNAISNMGAGITTLGSQVNTTATGEFTTGTTEINKQLMLVSGKTDALAKNFKTKMSQMVNDMGAARVEAKNLLGQIAALKAWADANVIRVRVVISVSGGGALGIAGVTGAARGVAGVGGKRGLSMSVPAGYQNDSYYMGIAAQSGERILVLTRAQQKAQAELYNNMLGMRQSAGGQQTINNESTQSTNYNVNASYANSQSESSIMRDLRILQMVNNL